MRGRIEQSSVVESSVVQSLWVQVCVLAVVLLLSITAHAAPSGHGAPSATGSEATLGGFTPNPEITLSFRRSRYPVSSPTVTSQAVGTVSISGPQNASGRYSVRVTGPNTDTGIELQIGGAPGSNAGDVTVNLPQTPGQVTYTARATIGGREVSDEAVLTAVAVKELQYRLVSNGAGQGEYSDVPDPLIVPVGQSVEFKALPDPAGDWPQNKPAWGKTGDGVVGAEGTGETTTVVFNQTGVKTVTAESGNTVTANILCGILTVSTPDDHLEADGVTTAPIKVHLGDANGNPFPNVPISLGTSGGELKDTAMITDSAGNGAVDVNDDGVIQADEPRETILSSPDGGVLAKVTAVAGEVEGKKSVLFHKVLLSDFSQPKLLAYDPDSTEAAKQNPQFTFTISDQPSVAQNFSVTFSIHSLEGQDAIATKTETLAPGTYTRSWSDFFYSSGQEANGRVTDPGAGIYPFQIEAVVDVLKPEEVEDITDKDCAHADWKSSKTLSINWTQSFMYHDDLLNSTRVGYAFQVRNTNRENAPPVETNIAVYDPDMELVKTVPVNFQADQADPHLFVAVESFSFDEMLKAGKYHFVVETKEQD